MAVGGMLRLATMDKFQREESKVVFLSTVRRQARQHIQLVWDLGF